MCFSLRLHLSGDGKCVICDSFVNPNTLVHICDECNYGSNENRCVVCGNVGVTDAYYCRECVQQGKHCEGCPKIVNLGAVRECDELFVFVLREALFTFPKRIDFDFLPSPSKYLYFVFYLLTDKNGFILRAEKVWIQKEVAQASLFAIHCSVLLQVQNEW